MTVRAKLLRTSTFRLAALYLILFVVSVGALLGYVYLNTAVLLQEQTDYTIHGIRGDITFSTSMSIDGTEAQNTIDSLEKNFPDASRGTGQVIFHTANGLPFTEAEKITDASGKVSYEAEVGHYDILFDAQGRMVKKEKAGSGSKGSKGSKGGKS